ncbi:hypothetical protein [Deinococcus hopiensis]|nr:hypothetical protein [Deinococcus hopiensis]
MALPTPPRSGSRLPGVPDPWDRGSSSPTQRAEQALRRGMDLGQRALSLGGLLLLGVLAFAVFAGLLLGLGILLAGGNAIAGWLMGLVLILALVVAAWFGRRASQVLRAPPESAPQDVPTPPSIREDEAGLLALLRAGERALPAPGRAALHATVIATRDALRVTAGDAAFGRDTHDARQAAREDLPELLHTYQSGRRTPETDRLFLEQLDLIGGRMREVVQERQAQHVRTLTAQRRYLESKYREGEE